MTQVFALEGLHCSGCASRAEKAVQTLAPGATVTLEPPRLTLPQNVALDAVAINTALAKMGDYKASPLPKG